LIKIVVSIVGLQKNSAGAKLPAPRHRPRILSLGQERRSAAMKQRVFAGRHGAAAKSRGVLRRRSKHRKTRVLPQYTQSSKYHALQAMSRQFRPGRTFYTVLCAMPFLQANRPQAAQKKSPRFQAQAPDILRLRSVFIRHFVIFSCFTFLSMTWREASSLWISSSVMPCWIMSTMT